MLEQIAKKDKYWRQIALSFCGCKMLADDLVQEMYIRRYDNDRGQELKDSYIIATIFSVYMNYLKTKKQNISYDLLYNVIKSNDSVFEPDDKEQFILDNLTFLEREILNLKTEISYHEIQRKYNINYQFARRIVENVKLKYGKEKE